jgi:hypothetical protein
VAARYQLDLAIMWWLTGPADGAGTLARIDGWLWDAGDDVARAIAAWAAGRLGRLGRPAEVDR